MLRFGQPRSAYVSCMAGPSLKEYDIARGAYIHWSGRPELMDSDMSMVLIAMSIRGKTKLVGDHLCSKKLRLGGYVPGMRAHARLTVFMQPSQCINTWRITVCITMNTSTTIELNFWQRNVCLFNIRKPSVQIKHGDHPLCPPAPLELYLENWISLLKAFHH